MRQSLEQVVEANVENHLPRSQDLQNFAVMLLKVRNQ